MKTRKRIFRILYIVLGAMLTLLGIASLILYTQQERLTQMALRELNKQLPGDLVVGGSDIAPFENFPYVSIGLKNVTFYADKQHTGKPLYQVERLFIGFSLPDIIRQKYNVKVLVVKKGYLHLVKSQNGKIDIVEANRIQSDSVVTPTGASSPMNLDIKKIILRDLDISYTDKVMGSHIATHIDKIKTSFKMEGDLINATMEGKQLIDYTTPGDTVLFRRKHIETDLKLSYDSRKQLLNLPVGKLKLEQASFNVTGYLDMSNGNLVDVKLEGDKPDINLLLSFAPASVTEQLNHFKYDGRISFKGMMKGKLGDGKMPYISVNFGCENAYFLNPDANKKVDSLSFKGYYTNGAEHSLKTSELHILNMSALPEKGLFKGNFVMRDFTDPKIVMQVNSELELEFIGAFLGIKDLQKVTGHISLNMNFNELVDMQLPEASLGKLKEGIQSELTVSNLTFRIPGYPSMVRNMNLHANMKNGQVTLDSLALRVGHSDIVLGGSLSDLPAVFHKHQQPVKVTLHAHSNKVLMSDVLAFDTAKAKIAKEEINGFNIALSFETSVHQLLHAAPLPKGTFRMEKLNASFKYYPHAFHDFAAEVAINDTALLMRNFGGLIDSTDLKLSARVINYQLWFDNVKRGKTQIAFDLKSQHLAMNDLLGKISRNYVPKDYQHEVASNLWLRAKCDMKYDSIFKFAKLHIANISGSLKVHPINLEKINGTIMYGNNRFIRIDTLTGKIGNSDFDISGRLFYGKDTTLKKKPNFLTFKSEKLDVDQLTNYKFSGVEEEDDKPLVAPTMVRNTVTDSIHKSAFNIFNVPFTDITVDAVVGKVKYHHLWIKDFTTKMRMQANHHLYVDTMGMHIAEGTIGLRGHFDGSDPAKIMFRSRTRFNDVNIEKMMLKLDYFGQDYVINKNVKGRLFGQVRCRVLMHPDLTPRLEDSEAVLDVDIRNGSLVNFTPMQAMASYFKDKNLNKINFDTLRNKLTLKNGVLEIPNMNINSSLGFIEISGKQGLDFSMEYYLRVPMKVVTSAGWQGLFGRKKEEVDPDQEDAIEYRDRNKTIRFMNIKVTGTPDKFKVGLGKAKKA